MISNSARRATIILFASVLPLIGCSGGQGTTSSVVSGEEAIADESARVEPARDLPNRDTPAESADPQSADSRPLVVAALPQPVVTVPDLGAAVQGVEESLPEKRPSAFDLIDPADPEDPEGGDEPSAVPGGQDADCPPGYHWVD